MGDRRKRVRTLQAAAAMENCAAPYGSGGGSSDGSSTVGPEVDGRQSVDLSLLEGGSFVSRCSVRLIHDVVSKFDADKKELVKSTGFGAILKFPPMKQINRRFSQWLMSLVDERLCAITIGSDICMPFDKFDVAHVFGLPATGKLVLDTLADSRGAKECVIGSYLGTLFKEQRSIKLVQEIVEREYDRPISKEEGDRFKVAFVVFVVSNLLSPSAKYDYAAVDCWNAIQYPDDICRYDWCGFVITKLLEAATKVKQDMANNTKFPNLTGCSIFLQVLYLDSMDLGDLSMPHDTVPRITVFPFETIRTMMMADLNFKRHCNGDTVAPAGKLRDATRCIYSWAVEAPRAREDSRTGCLLAIWETAVALVKLLNIPLEAAGPLFVAIFDFQEQINAGLVVCGTQAIKFVSLIASLMTPYARGFRYQPSYERDDGVKAEDAVAEAVCNGMRLLSLPFPNRLTGSRGPQSPGLINSRNAERDPSGRLWLEVEALGEQSLGNGLQRSLKRSFQTFDELPHSKNTDIRVATTMSRFYYAFRKLKPDRQFDLNHCGYGVIGEASSSSQAVLGGQVDVRSPWEIGYEWPICGVDVESASQKFGKMEHDERIAIVHYFPKYIQVKYCALSSQFRGKCEMEVDLFDALVRTAKRGDDTLYAGTRGMRWRYFFESDFMGVILDGRVDIADTRFRDHLPLSAASYDLRQCKLVFFPALIQCQWVCFVWKTEANSIAAFDPCYEGYYSDARVKVIERAAYMLKLCLKMLCGSVFTGVPCDVFDAEMFSMKLAGRDLERYNRSGVLCSMFYRCYDGLETCTAMEKVEVDVVAAKLLDEVWQLVQRDRSTAE